MKGFAVCCVYTAMLVMQAITMCLCLSSTTFGEVEVEGKIEPTIIETVEEEEINRWEQYKAEALTMVTEEDVVDLAKVTYGEARGVPSTMEKAAVMWCVCNRADINGCSISTMASNRGVFYGYSRNNPVTDELKALAQDVLTRYYMEKLGLENVGRVLPRSYLFFHGKGGRNHFREKFNSRTYYSWYLDNPYSN